jgi:hypothetical protein
MSDRLLKSWTRVPLIRDWRNAKPLVLKDLPSPPWAVLAQQAVGDMDADFGDEAAQRFGLHAVGAPARSIGWCGSDPLGELHHLRLATNPPDPPPRKVRLHPDVAVSPRFKAQVYDLRKIGRCRKARKATRFPYAPVSDLRKNDTRRTPVFAADRYQGARTVMLHCWPFIACEAAETPADCRCRRRTAVPAARLRTPRRS